MTPHGPHNPVSPDFDPAGYPHRAWFQGGNPDAATLIAWTNTGTLDMDFAEAAGGVMARGGHVLILATTPAIRDRARAALLALADVLRAEPAR